MFTDTAPATLEEKRRVLVMADGKSIHDKAKMDALECYLQAEFPDFEIVVARKNVFGGKFSMVTQLTARNGQVVFSEEEADRVTASVCDAMFEFLERKCLH